MEKNVVVIGAGLAGTLICNELVKNCDVTLFEAGEKNVIGYPEINFIQKNFAAVKTFCIGGGGTTNNGGRWCLVTLYQIFKDFWVIVKNFFAPFYRSTDTFSAHSKYLS